MNKFLNFIFAVSIPCYICDWYDYIVLGDRSMWIYLILVSLTMFYIMDIPDRIKMYKKHKTIWY